MRAFSSFFLILALLSFLVGPLPVLSAKTEADITAEIDQVNIQLNQAMDQYNSLLIEIEQTDIHIGRLKEERLELDHEIETASVNLNKRMAGVYKYGNVDMFDILLSSRTVNELTQRLSLLKRVTVHDFQLLESVREKKSELGIKADELEEERMNRNRLLAYLTSQRISIENDLRERQLALSDLQSANQAQQSTTDKPAPQPIKGDPSTLTRSDEGIATWYEFTGSMTAAHNSLPLGTMVRVTNLSNGKQVWVEIVDRGIAGSAIIDLERAAFSLIADSSDGICQVRIEW